MIYNHDVSQHLILWMAYILRRQQTCINHEHIVSKVKAKLECVAAVGRISIYFYTEPEHAEMEQQVYRGLANSDVEDPTFKLDLLWKVSLPLCTTCPAMGHILVNCPYIFFFFVFFLLNSRLSKLSAPSV